MSILSGAGARVTEEELSQPVEEDLQSDEQTRTRTKSGRRTKSKPAIILATPLKPVSSPATSSSATLSNPPLDKSPSSERPKSPVIENASAGVAEPVAIGTLGGVDSPEYSEPHGGSLVGATEVMSMVIDGGPFLEEKPSTPKKSYVHQVKRRTCCGQRFSLRDSPVRKGYKDEDVIDISGQSSLPHLFLCPDSIFFRKMIHLTRLVFIQRCQVSSNF